MTRRARRAVRVLDPVRRTLGRPGVGILQRMTAAALAVGMLLTVTACGGLSQVCTAQGWSNSLVIDAPARVGGLDVVGVCVDGSCSSGAEATPAADDLNSTTRGSDGEWVQTRADMSLPGTVTVRLVGEDGAVLDEQRVTVEWTRIGGSEQCGGPHEARIELSPRAAS